MSSPSEGSLPPEESWEAPLAEGERFIVDLTGFEGPLDVLLTLARKQKVDLARISILELADQYLAFIGAARPIRLDLAADYLVMAAWLAYLKSRLLLPAAEPEEPAAEVLAERLALQLRRLEAMRQTAKRLFARPLLGREVFVRGAPEGVPVERAVRFEATLYDLLSCFAEQRRRNESLTLRIRPHRLFTIEEAMRRLGALLGGLPDWETLSRLLPGGLQEALLQRSALASTFAASLELARLGQLQLRQFIPFGPLYMRRAPDSA